MNNPILLFMKMKGNTMMKTKNKKVCMRDALRQLHQPKSVYVDYLNSSEQDQIFLEHVVDTILTKGYMPA